MKTKFFSILFTTFAVQFAHAQTEAEKKIREEMWEKPHPEFKATQVPDKWKNESAVMLGLHREYVSDFTTRMRGLSLVKLFVQKLT